MRLCPYKLGLNSALDLALRDMRWANGRDPEAGEGAPNESWIALVMGMVVLNLLADLADEGVDAIISSAGVLPEDAKLICQVGVAVMSGYRLPQGVVMTAEPEGPVIDASVEGHPALSIPAFCGLVERLAEKAPEGHLLNTNAS